MEKIAWKPHPGPQTMALSAPTEVFEILYGGARGGGKTDAGLAWLVGNYEIENGDPNSVAFHPQYRALVIRRNAEDLSDWIDRARMFYRSFNAEVVGKPAVIRLPSGATIRTGHLKDESAYTKYLGHEYHRILIEELTLIPREEDYLKLISSCRSTLPELRPQVFLTTNPGGLGHVWVKQRFVDFSIPFTPKKDHVTERYRVFIPAKVADNPTLMENDPTYIQFLKGLPDEQRRAGLDGDWDVFSGQFLKKWRNDVHVVEPFSIPEEWTRIIAIDWGYAAPCAVGWYAKSFDGIVYKYRELYVTEYSPLDLAKEIKALSKDEEIYTVVGDPSMWIRNPMSTNYPEAFSDKSIAMQMSYAGLPLMKANNARISGWTELRRMLDWDGHRDADGKLIITRPPKYHVFNTCHNTIRLLPALVHDQRNVDDVDTTCEDHIGDCDRYALMHISESHKDEPKREMTRTEKKWDMVKHPEKYEMGHWLDS